MSGRSLCVYTCSGTIRFTCAARRFTRAIFANESRGTWFVTIATMLAVVLCVDTSPIALSEWWVASLVYTCAGDTSLYTPTGCVTLPTVLCVIL